MAYVVKNDRYLHIEEGVNEDGQNWWTYEFGAKENATSISEERARNIVDGLVDVLYYEKGWRLSTAQKQYQIILH